MAMHEMTLALQICRTARDHTPAGGCLRRIVVECGPLAGVVPEALAHCFPIAAERNGFPAVELDLRLPPAQARCSACGGEQQVSSMWDACAACGHLPLTVKEGRQLVVRELELELELEDEDV